MEEGVTASDGQGLTGQGSGFALSGAPGSALRGRKVAGGLCVGGGGQAGLQAVAAGGPGICIYMHTFC